MALWTAVRKTKRGRGESSNERIWHALQTALYDLETWCSKWRVKINASKSQLIQFPKNNQITRVFKLFDQQIKPATEAKILGLKIGPSLTLESHCLEKKQQAYRQINLLKRLRGTNWGTNTKTLLHLYKSYIRPVLETGYVATAAAPKSSIKHLEIAECKALRVALKQFYRPGEHRTTNRALYEMAEILEISSRLQELKTKALIRYEDSPLMKKLHAAT